MAHDPNKRICSICGNPIPKSEQGTLRKVYRKTGTKKDLPLCDKCWEKDLPNKSELDYGLLADMFSI